MDETRNKKWHSVFIGLILCVIAFGITPITAMAVHEKQEPLNPCALTAQNRNINTENNSELKGGVSNDALRHATSSTIMLGSNIDSSDDDLVSFGVQTDNRLYTITVIEPVYGEVTVEPRSDNGYMVGEAITLTVTPYDDYAFDKWRIVSGSLPSAASLDLTKATLEFTMPASNLEFEAEFKEASAAVYNVVVTNDGNGSATADVTSGTTGTEVTLIATPNNGYEFDKWEVVSGGVDIVGDRFTIGNGDVEVRATFKEKGSTPPTGQYTITFDPNGGEGTMDPQSFNAGESATLNENKFVRTGYKFDSWNTRADGSGTRVKDKAQVRLSTNTTLYAQWIQDSGGGGDSSTYTISFNANGGSGSMSSISVNPGESVVLSANEFTRSGYTFNGWNMRANGTGAAYGDQAIVTPSGSMTLYAQWRPSSSTPTGQYTITFDPNGGTGKMKAQLLNAGETAELNENMFAREGYIFYGWNTKADGSGALFRSKARVKLTEDVTLYAQWLVRSIDSFYSITFNGNGGSGSMTSILIIPGESVVLAANGFTRLGDTFIGWNTRADGSGTAYDDLARITVNDNITLYAQWQSGSCSLIDRTYTITFNSNGGSGLMPSISVTQGESVVSVMLLANEFTRSGYTFSGWNMRANGTGAAYGDQAIVTPSGSMTLYAQWRPSSSTPTGQYTITFDPNGGAGTMDPQSFNAGESTTLNANQFTRHGYTFSGWNTKADGSGTRVKDKAEVKLSSNVTLYAQWQSIGIDAKTVFVDVTSETAHLDDISWLYATQISEGWNNANGTKSFRPYASVARSDMAAFLFRLAIRWGIVSKDWQPTNPQKAAFADITDKGTGRVALAREVWWLAAEGISEGWNVNGRNEFRPYATVKRQDMAAFLFRLAKRAGIGGASNAWNASENIKIMFSDVDAQSQSNHHNEIWWLAETGISEGWYVGGNQREFRGMSEVKRCDMAAFLHRIDNLR